MTIHNSPTTRTGPTFGSTSRGTSPVASRLSIGAISLCERAWLRRSFGRPATLTSTRDFTRVVTSSPTTTPFTLSVDGRGLLISLTFIGIGFSPIGALALAIGGLWTLSTGAMVMIAPSIVLAIVLSVLSPRHGRMALEGFVAGLVAVLVYDMVRWDFVAFHLWGDFIPNIGGWLDGSDRPNWLLGYGFRWLGDGGGLGLSFMVAARTFAPTLARRSPLSLAIGYGMFVWVCLLVTLIASPDGQTLLFPITLTTLLLSWIGHVVYGSVLGLFFARGEITTRRFGRVVRFNLTAHRVASDSGREGLGAPY